MESGRDSTPPIRRKPINIANAVARPTSVESGSVEPAREPLLLDQENDPITPTKAFDQKQSASAVGVVPINDRIYTSNLNQEDIAVMGYMTEKVSPRAEAIVPSKVSWETTLRRIIKGWWQEMLCCLVSVVALVILTMILKKFNNQPLPDWPSGITLNTVLACMATICRSALLVPVTEGLAQAKWVWFKQPRPLKDFKAFDKASRGLGGSLSLLSHTKGWFVGIIAAFLLTTTIATSTITQFAVTYPSRVNPDGSKGSAEAWRLGESWGKDEPNFAFMNVPAIARGVRRGIHNLVTERIPFREPWCASANCRWPEFRTLAIGYKVTTVTHLIEADVNFHDGNPNITLPNGVHTEPGKSRARYTGAPTFFLGSGQTLVHQYLGNASILDYFAIYWEPYNRIPWAVEVSLYWCIDTYHPELVDDVLRIDKSASRISKLHALQGDDNRGYVPLELSGNVTWTIGGLSTRTIATQLNESLSGYTVDLAGEPMRGTSGSDILAQATKEVVQKLAKGNSTLEIEHAERAWQIALSGMAENVANSLTNTSNRLLPDQSNVDGVSLNTEVALSICLLICVIVESAKAEVEVMKGSTVPVLFAINAVDKARMENRDIDLDSLRQMKHYQQLANINLHKVGQKWVLQ
ncbi:hypothetical protein FSPOR_10401 [Fusarium sporotrichioides]|uniref:Uncharacterized protein n=1 Tax=Fusarium sporotrichioides TaxID=5514 RepID=A0A395RL98_FUSSP|nr:hypothetical protein FSPOR_10401 [Fusarium sporotrichioides]